MNNDALKKETLKLVSLCEKAISDGFKIAVTGHDMPDCDSVISAVMLRELLLRFEVESTVKFGTRPDRLTERDTKRLGIFDEIDFGGFSDDDALVLVDHHQSFYGNKVLACVDHHLTPPEPNFDFNLVLKASSCGRMVYDMALSCGVSDDAMEKLAIYSVYLDTQSTLAPKFVKSDLPWLKEGIERLFLDECELIKAGFCLNSTDEEESGLAMYGYKKYELGGRFGASTYIQIDPSEDVWQSKIDRIIPILKAKMESDGAAVWAFLVNMPEITRTDIYFIRRDGVEIVKLDRLASRSRDVVPVVMRELGCIE